MNRREFLWGSIAFGSTIILGGCGGGSSEPSLILEQRKVQVSLNGDRTKEVSVPDDSSVLDAVKQAFQYEREGPLENPSALTKIDGISGHWRYEVDGNEPLVNAVQYPVTSDCFIELLSI